jgi:hypothetical protein
MLALKLRHWKFARIENLTFYETITYSVTFTQDVCFEMHILKFHLALTGLRPYTHSWNARGQFDFI